MAIIELTRFQVRADRRDALLASRREMLRDFAADRTGFIDARLVELPDGEWLDIVRWRSADDFDASRKKGANRPGIQAFFAAISQVVSSEQGAEAEVAS
jgi:quinol monooxygenase YgiN